MNLTRVGQRYHVVIEANPADELTPIEDRNYWIRATPAVGCNPSLAYPNETVGVIRYSTKSKKTPTTTSYLFNSTCQDEPYPSLVPVVQKTVGQAKNPCKQLLIIWLRHPVCSLDTSSISYVLYCSPYLFRRSY